MRIFTAQTTAPCSPDSVLRSAAADRPRRDHPPGAVPIFKRSAITSVRRSMSSPSIRGAAHTGAVRGIETPALEGPRTPRKRSAPRSLPT
jgi:hypothetical protein